MILTNEEADSLVEVRHRSPHTLLGMHELGDGSGLVVRAFYPHAIEIEATPVHEKNKPTVKLTEVRPGLFEGVTKASKSVYAYDLRMTLDNGAKIQTRDPYSFLPTLGETDLFLFGQGNERRIYEKLGAQLRTIDGAHGASFAVWAPTAQRVSVVGEFNQWDGRVHAMRMLGGSGVWEMFIPGAREGALYKFEIRTPTGAITLKTDPYGFFFETAPK